MPLNAFKNWKFLALCGLFAESAWALICPFASETQGAMFDLVASFLPLAPSKLLRNGQKFIESHFNQDWLLFRVGVQYFLVKHFWVLASGGAHDF